MNSAYNPLDVSARQVEMLRAAGAQGPDRTAGTVLRVLALHGVFRVGAVLVGSHAFAAYGPLLGIRWRAPWQTQEVDVAAEQRVGVAIDGATLPAAPAQTGLPFDAVPALDPRQPSTSFKVRPLRPRRAVGRHAQGWTGARRPNPTHHSNGRSCISATIHHTTGRTLPSPNPPTTPRSTSSPPSPQPTTTERAQGVATRERPQGQGPAPAGHRPEDSDCGAAPAPAPRRRSTAPPQVGPAPAGPTRHTTPTADHTWTPRSITQPGEHRHHPIRPQRPDPLPLPQPHSRPPRSGRRGWRRGAPAGAGARPQPGTAPRIATAAPPPAPAPRRRPPPKRLDRRQPVQPDTPPQRQITHARQDSSPDLARTAITHSNDNAPIHFLSPNPTADHHGAGAGGGDAGAPAAGARPQPGTAPRIATAAPLRPRRDVGRPAQGWTGASRSNPTHHPTADHTYTPRSITQPGEHRHHPIRPQRPDPLPLPQPHSRPPRSGRRGWRRGSARRAGPWPQPGTAPRIATAAPPLRPRRARRPPLAERLDRRQPVQPDTPLQRQITHTRHGPSHNRANTAITQSAHNALIHFLSPTPQPTATERAQGGGDAGAPAGRGPGPSRAPPRG
ncbi:MAG: hypothetical protein H6702_06080 [Myxococcales bacterium]|nr:hypothetical protein [Myxococcales bacterium]